MNASASIPLLIAVFTAVAGLLTYSTQKRVDRRNDLVKLRQDHYKRYLDAFQRNAEENTPESLIHYRKTLLEAFVVASDDVIKRLGELQNYMHATSPGGTRARDMRKFAVLLAEVMKAMRKDCFQKSGLEVSEIGDILPYQGIREDEEEDDGGIKHLDGLLLDATTKTKALYHELVSAGNPSGVNTAEITLLVFMAKSLSDLPATQVEYLRANKILTL